MTSGSYSDYGIRRVFLDKKKAEKYAKLSSNNYESYIVETYNTSDESIIHEITYVDVVYTKWSDGEVDFDLDINVVNNLDYSEEEINNTYIWISDGYQSIEIKRVINNNYDEDEIENRYRNVTYDLIAQLESLKKLEGWTEEMVENYLKEKVEEHFG